MGYVYADGTFKARTTLVDCFSVLLEGEEACGVGGENCVCRNYSGL